MSAPGSDVSTKPRLEAFGLARETALVTGGGTGIGLSIAKCLARAGANVVLVGRRRNELEHAAAEIGPGAFAVPHDLNEVERAKDLVERAETTAGASLSILVNNAGIHLKKPAVQVTNAEFQSVLQTHVLGAHALTAAALPGMIERRHGHVLFIASMASLFGIPQVIAYAAAKSAYLGMVRTLATEVSPHGVRVNAIAPGWIDTALMRKALDSDPARVRRILGRTPLAKFGSPEDVGWAAVYLCSPAARFITGITLPVDGGVSVGF